MSDVRQRVRVLPDFANRPDGPSIKAVFFDYDGVLTTDKTGSLTTNTYLSQTSGIELSKIKGVFGGYNEDLTLGKTTYAQIWPEVCIELGHDLKIGLLYEAFESTPLNASMFSLARRLKGGYSLGIITDNKKEGIGHLRVHQQLDSLFDIVVVSSEVRANKQDSAIFDHALGRLNLKPAECVFIDNNEENLVAPKALGIKTIFHDDARNDVESLVDVLESWGVVTNDV